MNGKTKQGTGCCEKGGQEKKTDARAPRAEGWRCWGWSDAFRWGFEGGRRPLHSSKEQEGTLLVLPAGSSFATTEACCFRRRHALGGCAQSCGRPQIT